MGDPVGLTVIVLSLITGWVIIGLAVYLGIHYAMKGAYRVTEEDEQRLRSHDEQHNPHRNNP